MLSCWMTVDVGHTFRLSQLQSIWDRQVGANNKSEGQQRVYRKNLPGKPRLFGGWMQRAYIV